MPRLILFVLSILFFSINSYCQFILTAPNGKKVQLSENGTWKYLDQKNADNSSGKTKYVSRFGKYHINYDPKLWINDSGQNEGSAWDAIFRSSDNSTYSYCIEYRTSYGSANLDSILRSTFESMGTITSFNCYEETINGVKVRSVDTELTWNDVEYKYKGLINNLKTGTFQFIVGTQKNVFEEDLQKINDLINGFGKNE